MVDAGGRINTLLGVLTAVGWGNSGSGWWCRVTHGSLAGGMQEFKREELESAIKALQALSPKVKRKVASALHWIREPRQMLMEGYRSDVLQTYAGYWNAFECLVEAVCVLRPQPKRTKAEKQTKIDQFLTAQGGRIDAASITNCCRLRRSWLQGESQPRTPAVLC